MDEFKNNKEGKIDELKVRSVFLGVLFLNELEGLMECNIYLHRSASQHKRRHYRNTRS